MNTKLLASIILSLLIGTGIGYSVSFPQISTLQSEPSSLESETSTLKTDYNHLNSTCNQFKDNYSNLNSSCNELLARYNTLQDNYNSLNSTCYELQKAYQQLEEVYEATSRYEPSILFDKNIYYPEIEVFWNQSLVVPIRIMVTDRNVAQNFVTVRISSSIDQKEVMLTKNALGVFSATVLATGIRLGESVSNATVFKVRYGDRITVEYLNVQADAFFVFPKYLMYWRFEDITGRWEIFDKEGVVMWDYRGTIGIQYNPVTISQYALHNYQRYLDSGNATFREKFFIQANWLVKNAVQKGNYSVWEYRFDWPSFGMTDPWVSAMAQGLGLSVLIRSYVLSGNTTYLDIAESAMNAFEIEMSEGGVRYTDSDDV